MVHWQLGNSSKANELFDRSVEWMKENHSDELLIQFREEAEALLDRKSDLSESAPTSQ